MNRIKQLWRDPYSRFVVLFISIYLALYWLNIAYIGITSKGGYYVPFLAEDFNYINWWRTFTLESTATALRWFNYTVYTNDFQLKVLGGTRITLVYSCLGYGVMSAFTAFALTFPVEIKRRYTFLLLGIVLIQLINTLRIALLALYWDKRAPFLNMDHHDLFNIAVYAVLIIFSYSWLKYNTNPDHKQLDQS